MLRAQRELPLSAVRLDPEELRTRLSRARLMLVFSPELCAGRDPLAVLEAVLPHVDLVQVRPKPAAERARADIAADPPTEARASYDWTLRALELAAACRESPPVLVNDRVDVALALLDRGCAGVHLGQEDLPPAHARALLGPEPLIGFSTHDARQVVAASELPIDYLGFGPVFATTTKGYARGLGAETCWVASSSTSLPVFAIGGVTRENALELERTGRAAVGAGILAATDPADAARAIRELLGPP